MKPEYQALLLAIKLNNKRNIERADADPHQWYELFVNEGPKTGSHTETKGSTFEEVASRFESVAEEYGLDRINIDIWWTTNGMPKPHTELFTSFFMYKALRDYFALSGELSRMKMVGTVSYDANRSKDVFTREHCGEGEYFADEVAFRYFRNVVCHVCEHIEPADPNDESGIIGPDQGVTRADLVAMCGGDENKAAKLFGRLDWRSPETLLDDWDDD